MCVDGVECEGECGAVCGWCGVSMSECGAVCLWCGVSVSSECGAVCVWMVWSVRVSVELCVCEV